MKVADYIFSAFVIVLIALLICFSIAVARMGIETNQERSLAEAMVNEAFGAARRENDESLYALYVLSKAIATAPNTTRRELLTSRDYRLFIGEQRKKVFDRKLAGNLSFSHDIPMEVIDPPEPAPRIK